MSLPFEATLNSPSQDPRKFSFQFFRQRGISFASLKLLVKRDEPQSTPDRIVASPNGGLVICGQPDFKLGRVFEEFTEQKPACNPVLPCHLLDDRFVKALLSPNGNRRKANHRSFRGYNTRTDRDSGLHANRSKL
jgi:hypothetical protein